MTRVPAPALLDEIPGAGTATWSRLPSHATGVWLMSRSRGSPLVVRSASDVEVAAARAAALTRVGAPVVAAADGWLAVEYLPGSHVSVLELSRPSVLADLGRLLSHWHGADVALPESSLASARATYLSQVPAGGAPVGLTAAVAEADTVEAELASTSRQRSPAHLDVVANLIDTDHGLRLIDFEYAAAADPARELGQVVWEGELDRAAAARLVQAYDPTRGVAEGATAAWAWVTGVTWTVWAYAREDQWERYARRSWERLQSYWARPSA